MWRRVVAASAVVMVLCIVGFVGNIVIHAVTGDSDKYGRIAIPGSGTVSLPAGEMEIDFAVSFATNGSGGGLTVPPLSFTMTGPDGTRDPVVTEDNGVTISVNNHAHIRVWKVQVKDAGTYDVTTDGDVAGYIQPQLTFGRGSPVPRWPMPVFAVVFAVALGLLLVGRAAGRHANPPRPATAGPAPQTATVPYGTPSSIASTGTTPEQEMERLADLQKLTDLHTAGTLTDQEYDAAKRRLGG